jgi:hypothetical protein
MPALFESIILDEQQQKPFINKEKSFGKKIKKAFYITLLFILFIHSFTVLDNINFVITQKQFEFIDQETGVPNIKGYIISSILVFLITLIILS